MDSSYWKDYRKVLASYWLGNWHIINTPSQSQGIGLTWQTRQAECDNANFCIACTYVRCIYWTFISVKHNHCAPNHFLFRLEVFFYAKFNLGDRILEVFSYCDSRQETDENLSSSMADKSNFELVEGLVGKSFSGIFLPFLATFCT